MESNEQQSTETVPVTEQAMPEPTPPRDVQVGAMEQSKRLLSNIETLLGEGLYAGSQCERVGECRRYIKFLKAQASEALEALKKARHEAGKEVVSEQ